MKFTGLAAASIACCTAQQVAASTPAHVHTFDPRSPPQPDSPAATLSPTQARLVLAQRAGVEDYHTADLLSDGVLDALNTYGLRTPLFEAKEPKRAFIFVNRRLEYPLKPSYLQPAFTIDPAPSSAHNQQLFIDLATQSLPDELLNLTVRDRLTDALGCDVSAIHAAASHLYCVASSEAELQHFTDALVATHSWAITTLSTSGEPIADAISQDWTYGTYEMPNAQSALRHSKRALPQKEAPLELENPPIVHSTIPVSSYASDDNETSTVHGILPACFTSQAQCESLTSNCAGHGSCSLSYTNKGAAEKSPFRNCYACSCSSTTTTDSEGRKKTTQWGGPACQKKDISVEFWLFAFFFVAMLGLIGFAVGEVWGMGDQELPSVIGAGVSGPVKR